jgi:hypothetical protein
LTISKLISVIFEGRQHGKHKLPTPCFRADLIQYPAAVMAGISGIGEIDDVDRRNSCIKKWDMIIKRIASEG